LIALQGEVQPEVVAGLAIQVDIAVKHDDGTTHLFDCQEQGAVHWLLLLLLQT
jgi:hypothetical protein